MQSSTVMYFVGFALAFDFTVVAMSIQSYWSITGGNPAHYGFAFGCYDLTQFLFIPLFGKISDTCGMKFALIITLSLNILGNVMYALAFWFSNPNTGGTEGDEYGHWEMILVGRLVAGCGSAALGLGVTFFTVTTSIRDRDEAITTYRIAQTIARSIATQAPMALTAFPTTISTPVDRVFNFYTIPGWITTVLSSVALVLVLVFFKTPEGEAMYHGAFSEDFRGSFFGTKSDMGALWYHVVMFSVSGLITTFAVYAIYSQLFALAFAKYQLIDNMQDMYIVFIGLAVGATVGIVLFKMLHSARGKAAGVRDYMFILSGNLFFIVGLSALLLPQDVCYYIGTGFLGAGLILFFPMCESFYTKKISQYAHVIPKQIGLYTAFMPACGSLGRFLGPTIGALLFTVNESTFQQVNSGFESCGMHIDLKKAYEDEGYLPKLVQNATQTCTPCGDATEDGSLSDECQDVASLCHFDFPAYFFKDGCLLDDFHGTEGLIAGLTVVFFSFCFYFKNHRLLPQETAPDRETAGLTEPINRYGAE